MSDRNVVLTGFMGTGKTTVGRALADRLGWEFVDTDRIIEERHGPINEIFAEHGEGAFRQFERDVADELADRRRLVIATGGRMLVDAVNAQRLAETGDVVCLVASLDTILERVDVDGAGATRPLLRGDDVRARVAALLAERSEAYGAFWQLDTDGRSPDELAVAIIEHMV
ncbi:MAG: shikimate kinase [Ilumatobacteraceae bacterium]|nr:shikimate kinase [Ilumatobacteraceae bacterium]